MSARHRAAAAVAAGLLLLGTACGSRLPERDFESGSTPSRQQSDEPRFKLARSGDGDRLVHEAGGAEQLRKLRGRLPAGLFHAADRAPIHLPLSHEPIARPNMNTDRTVDRTGVMTPNEAKPSRSQTIW